MKFKHLKPGDLFRIKGGQLYLVPNFDIFVYDHVIRTRKENAATCIIIDGINAGKYDGVFRDDTEVECVNRQDYG